MDGLLLSILAGCTTIASTPSWLDADLLAVLAVPLATAAFLFVMDAVDKRRARRATSAARAAQLQQRPDQQWAIALLVDVDEQSGMLRPTVQLLGPQLPADVTIELLVADESGDLRLTGARRFSSPAAWTDLVLGTLTLPDSVCMATAALCDWSVVVGHNGREIARRGGPLAAAPCLNEEGELQAPDLERAPDREPKPDAAELPRATAAPVRSWRLTIGLAGAFSGIVIGAYLLTMLTVWLWLIAAPIISIAAPVLWLCALTFYLDCPLCGRPTSVDGRTGRQVCDSCKRSFTLAPSAL